MIEVESRSVRVNAVGTHYLEAGVGAPLVLLHGGAWGESARTAWAPVIPALAAGRRVIAPDWLGFGDTDKIVDFADRAGRMLAHLSALLERLDAEGADVVGLSMGGSHLLRDQTADHPLLDVRRMVLVSAGGPPVAGPARQALMNFDGTEESMRAQIRLAFADPAWAADDAFVRARLIAALRPGAFEAFDSLRLRAPGTLPPPFGDPFDYRKVRIPTLLTVGDADRLKPHGYGRRVAAQIPGCRLEVFAGCGHCPHLEAADAWTKAVLDFLDRPETEEHR